MPAVDVHSRPKNSKKRRYVPARDLPDPGVRSTYTAAQTAAKLQISVPTVVRLWKSGALGSIYIGDRRFSRHPDIEAFLSNGGARLSTGGAA